MVEKLANLEMKKLNEIILILKDNEKHLKEKYKIKRLGLFGSVCRGEATDESDIDVLAEFEEPIGLEFVDLADELEKILGHKVDLVSKGGIKPSYFRYVQEDLIYV